MLWLLYQINHIIKERSVFMSLFLPSNLSPNFEEITPQIITDGNQRST